MASVKAHTLRIADIYAYAQDIEMPFPLSARTPTECPLINGDPKWYYGPRKLRQFKCLLTLYGTNKEIRDQLKTFNDLVVPIVSVNIGSFNAMVTMPSKILNATPGVWKVSINIQEVT